MPKNRIKSVAHMSEEQKILYMEQQMMADEEANRQKKEMLHNYLKEKLAKEEKLARFNLNKLNHQWRDIQREAKTRELKRDMEILAQTFERVVDRKDSVIRSHVRDITEAEEQYSMAFRAHMANMRRLLDIQRSRLETWQNNFNMEKGELEEEFGLEMDIARHDHERQMNEVRDIIIAIKQKIQGRESKAISKFQADCDGINNKAGEEQQALRYRLQTRSEELLLKFQEAEKVYKEATEERRKECERLQQKDRRSAAEIEAQMKRLQKINENILQVKAKMTANAKECEERNRQLKEDKDKMVRYFQKLKSEMSDLQIEQREKLKKLTILSSEANKQLQRKAVKGEKILKLAEICRKLETEEEKVLPFYASTLTEEEQEEQEAKIREQPKEEFAKVMGDFASLENFWKRYNKVLLDKMSLEKDRLDLQRENDELRAMLKQYLEAISDHVPTQTDELVVVNHRKPEQRINVPVGDSRVRARSTVVISERVGQKQQRS